MRRTRSLLFWPLLICLLASVIHVSSALRCYFCYGSDESGDCKLPEDDKGNILAESTATMRIISCLEQDEYCYKISYSFSGKPVTGRGCGNETFCDNHMRTRLTQYAPRDEINECSLCSRGLCNSSVKLSGTTATKWTMAMALGAIAWRQMSGFF